MICRADITGCAKSPGFPFIYTATVFWGFSDIPDRKLKINLTTNLSIWFIRMTGATCNQGVEYLKECEEVHDLEYRMLGKNGYMGN